MKKSGGVVSSQGLKKAEAIITIDILRRLKYRG